MAWNVIWLVVDNLFYPVIIVCFLGGLFRLSFGIQQRHKPWERTQQVPWYNDPTILEGMYGMALALFFGCWVTGTHLANLVVRVFLDVAALVCFGLFILCLQRANSYRALHSPKRRTRQMEEAPQQHTTRSRPQPKEAREQEQGPRPM